MIKGINHIIFSVKDLEEAFDFYKEILELKPIMKSSYSAYFEVGDTWLALMEEAGNKKRNLYNHIAFHLNQEDYYKLKELLVRSKVESWQDDKTEGESFYFCDPSGNKLEIHYNTIDDRIEYGKLNWTGDIKWFR